MTDNKAVQSRLRGLGALTRTISPIGWQLMGIVVLWFVYCSTIDAVSAAVMRDPGHVVWPGWSTDQIFHLYQPDLPALPPLARFDSVWYYSIATEGYAPASGWGRSNASFMPLYGLMMRWVGHAFGIEPYRAGIYISRTSLLVSMVLLYLYAHEKRSANSPPPWAPVMALLFYPTAYILVSVYSESTFLALSLATFFLADRKRYLPAAVTAFLAGLTRAHVVALIPALGLLALSQWKPRQWRTYLSFLPALGATAAPISIGVYFKRTFNDYFHYFEVKKSFGFVTGGPRVTWPSMVYAFNEAQRHGHFGALYTHMEAPVGLLLVVSTAILLWQKKWPEAALVSVTLMLQIVAGPLWGLPRYSILLFPMFMLISRLQRRPMLWHAYLFAGAVLQTAIMINFVNLRGPAP